MGAQPESHPASPARVWVIAGASRGIGEQYVAQVLRSGDAVVAAARRPEQSTGLAKLKQQHGAALQLVKLDVNDTASVRAAAEEVAREHPDGIDFLIINAAIADSHHKRGIETDQAELERVFGTNVFGAFSTIQAFYPLLKRKVNGVKAVVTLSSSAAQMGADSEAARNLGAPVGPLDRLQFAYKVSKTALNQVTVQLAKELKDEGFTFIAIHPGAVDTDMLVQVSNGGGPELASLLKTRAISTEKSVGNQLAYLATASQKRDNGRFVDHQGNTMDW